MKKILLACSLFLAACSNTQVLVPESSKMAAPELEKTLNWHEFNPLVFKKAQDQRKLMVVWFYDEYCPHCISMRTGALSNPCVVEELNKHYIFVGANITKQPALAGFLDEKVYPSTMLVFPDEDGSILGVVQGNIPATQLCKALKDTNEEFQRQLNKLEELERGH